MFLNGLVKRKIIKSNKMSNVNLTLVFGIITKERYIPHFHSGSTFYHMIHRVALQHTYSILVDFYIKIWFEVTCKAVTLEVRTCGTTEKGSFQYSTDLSIAVPLNVNKRVPAPALFIFILFLLSLRILITLREDDRFLK